MWGINLTVIATVCDAAQANIATLKLLGVDLDLHNHKSTLDVESKQPIHANLDAWHMMKIGKDFI